MIATQYRISTIRNSKGLSSLFEFWSSCTGRKIIVRSQNRGFRLSAARLLYTPIASSNIRRELFMNHCIADGNV